MTITRPLLLVPLLLASAACDSSSDDPPSGDATASDAATGDTGGGPDDTAATPSACPDDHVALTFSIDDSANQTYNEGELIWTGSFSHDAATHTITYATAWQPTDGPFPTLHDDGPMSAGGHEPEGATAGDHVFGALVCYLAEQDRLIAYGALNDDLRWIWVGPNGLVDIPAGTTGTLDLDPMVIGAHGDRDIELTLDLATLHPDFATIGLDTHKVFVKGTMNAWTPVQLLDAGILGDVLADDGLLTYRHSLYLGAHDGLLRPGQEAQFVFVFAMGDVDPDLAMEYKLDGAALPDGVRARALCLDGWIDAEIITSPDSKGVSLNTGLIVCPDDPDEPLTDVPPDCGPDTSCPGGEHCVDGACVSDDPACGDAAPCPSGQSCVDGACVTDTEPECDEATPCGDGESCIDGVCVPTPDGDCSDSADCTGPGEVCLDGACVVPPDHPELILVVPDTGSALGGTPVTLIGSGFDPDSTVTFDGVEATLDSLAQDEVLVTTPPHPPGTVDVTITSPDGGYSTFPGGFTYFETQNAPTLTEVVPNQGVIAGGDTVTLHGTNLQPGATVTFDTATATDVVVSSDGLSLTAVTPTHPLGGVTVSVTNPDGQVASLDFAFAFVPQDVDWGLLLGPATLTTFEGGTTAPLEAQVWEPGVTDSPGPGFGLTAEIGYGPVGSGPLSNDAWTWSPATFVRDEGNDDVWAGTLSPPLGTWLATLRFAIGAGDGWYTVDLDDNDGGFNSNELCVVTVEEAPAVGIALMTPASVWPPGGVLVTLTGPGLEMTCTATLDGESLEVTFADEALSFTAPPHAPGDAALELTCPGGSASTTLVYSETWDGALDEWPAGTLLASNTTPSSWTAANTLSGLYAATDGETLYVAIAGQAQGDLGAKNAIVAYIDGDLGGDTGLVDTATLTDESGMIDDVLGGVLAFDVAGYGAEVAFATLNMGSYVLGLDEPGTSDAGWRGLDPADDLPWLLSGSVHASLESVEALLPLSELYGPPTGALRTLGIVVRITNATGAIVADQALPDAFSGDAFETSTEAATFTLIY